MVVFLVFHINLKLKHVCLFVCTRPWGRVANFIYNTHPAYDTHWNIKGQREFEWRLIQLSFEVGNVKYCCCSSAWWSLPMGYFCNLKISVFLKILLTFVDICNRFSLSRLVRRRNHATLNCWIWNVYFVWNFSCRSVNFHEIFSVVNNETLHVCELVKRQNLGSGFWWLHK